MEDEERFCLSDEEEILRGTLAFGVLACGGFARNARGAPTG